MKIKKFNEIFEKLEPTDKVIKTTYQKLIPGDSDEDEYDEEYGWEDEDGESMLPDEYDIDDDITAVDKAVEFLKNKKYATEPSSSEFRVGISYSTTSPDINYSTGEETNYSCHLDGFTPEEEWEIYKIMTDWEKKQINQMARKYNIF